MRSVVPNLMEALDAILRSGADLQTVCEHKDMYDFESKSHPCQIFSWHHWFPTSGSPIGIFAVFHPFFLKILYLIQGQFLQIVE